MRMSLSRRQALPLLLLPVVLAGVFALGTAYKPFQAALFPTPTATPAPTPPPHPLSIAGLRSHKYTASRLTPVQDLGRPFGYHDAIVTYQSEGLNIRALMSTPPGTAPKAGWPVIVFAHGYIDPQVYRTEGPEYREFIAAFVRSGYMVIKPDYRGHGQSEGQAAGGYYAPDYTYDVLNLVATLKQNSDVDPDRIGLIGHSLGGHVALRALVVSPDIRASAILAGVVGSMNDIFYNWTRGPSPFMRPPGAGPSRRDQLVQEHGDPKTNPAFWDSVSAINYVDAIAGPVQIHHSVADVVVPALFSQHLITALEKAGKRAEYHEYPWDDHQFTANRAAVLQNLLTFYKGNL